MTPRILVIGDTILDEYVYCKYRKPNPEIDGFVYNIERKQYFLGAAAAVAMMCKSLDANIELATNVSMDADSRIVMDLLYQYKIPCTMQRYEPIQTNKKTRYVCDGELFPNRFDDEAIESISDYMSDTILKRIKYFDVILIADYGKGFITSYLLDNLPSDKSILVDPTISRSWGDYRKATLIKANEKEAIYSLQETRTISHITDYARTLADIYDRSVVVTRGEIGIQYANHNQTATTKDHSNGFVSAIKTQSKDICGAGDTVFAVLGVYLANGYTLKQACEYAVQYAAQQIQSFGIRPLTPIEIESCVN